MEKLGFMLSPKVERFIITVIIINAITLGMETSSGLMARYGDLLVLVDRTALAIFTIEILLKISCLKLDYFKNPWNIFDFIIVGIAYLPSAGGLSVLRSLRVLRVFLLISTLPRLRIIVRALVMSLPSIGSIALLMGILFYVAAVIATKIFGPAFPMWFGTLGETLFTLFQIMTLESWAMGIVRPISEQFPYAYLFFVPFVLVSSFIILNIFIAVIINAMNEERDHFSKLEAGKEAKAMTQERQEENLRKELTEAIRNLNVALEKMRRIEESGKAGDNAV